MADDIVERLRSAWWGEVGTDRTRVIQDAAAEIERLRAENEKALADRSEILRAADRLHVAASEALHCIASKGWRASDGIEWSVAGCQKHLHRELDGATDDMRVVLEAKNPSELERRGPYADVVRECERLRASEAQAIDDADALCEWLRYYDYPSCRFTTVVGAAIKPACMRALDRRAKKEATT